MIMNWTHCVWVFYGFAFRNLSEVIINCEWLISALVLKFSMVKWIFACTCEL